MKQNNIAVPLSIVYLIAFVVFNIYSYCLMELVAQSWSDQQFYLVWLALRLFMPVVMTAVLAFFMSREKHYSGLLLFFTFVTSGVGAIFYPLWLKKREAPYAAQLERYVMIYSVALAVCFVWPLVAGTHAWSAFLVRNDWAAYLPYLYNVVMAYLAVMQLREMRCRHWATWVCLIVLMLCSTLLGALALVLLYARYGSDYKAPDHLTKYWVVVAAQQLLLYAWGKVYNMLLMNNVYEVMEMSWLGSVIYDLGLVIVAIFLIKDVRHTSLKGKVWLILPVLATPIFPIGALKSANQIEE